jgi:Flp pilus assembly pilin Flp
MTKFSAFLNDETGAVTVDWVVLTAAVVGLGLIILNFVEPAVRTLSSEIAIEIDLAGDRMQSAYN